MIEFVLTLLFACVPPPAQHACTGSVWGCLLFDTLQHVEVQADYVTGPIDDYTPCCATSNGWTILIQPAEACASDGDVCAFAPDAILNLVYVPTETLLHDMDGDCDYDLHDFAIEQRGGGRCDGLMWM